MIKKILLNSTLLIVLLGLIGAPIGSMALMRLDESENPIVLSTRDEREVNDEYFPDENDLPEEIEEVIKKLEEEFYQATQSTQEVELDISLP